MHARTEPLLQLLLMFCFYSLHTHTDTHTHPPGAGLSPLQSAPPHRPPHCPPVVESNCVCMCVCACMCVQASQASLCKKRVTFAHIPAVVRWRQHCLPGARRLEVVSGPAESSFVCECMRMNVCIGCATARACGLCQLCVHLFQFCNSRQPPSSTHNTSSWLKVHTHTHTPVA